MQRANVQHATARVSSAHPDGTTHRRVLVRVEGVVQGVGFRPFVHALASRLKLAGRVGNDTAGVFIELEGASSAITDFLTALRAEAPPLAEIERVTVSDSVPTGDPADRAHGFSIAPSQPAGPRTTLVSADSATCAHCLRELADPTDRRYRYPFINCTNCGPRFTIVRDVPYDRPNTTMAAFTMCPACAREYHDPADRRFHAQPVCCPQCGPRLELTDPRRRALDLGTGGDPLADAVRLLRAGRILAIKGLGGFHLAVDAANEAAAARLRARKQREEKPFALLVRGVHEARRLCEVDEAEERLLTGRRRPIVLLNRRTDAQVAAAVAPGNRQLGVMLPYTPLHHLLAEQSAGPLVLTSGNLSDEPIAYTDDDAYARLPGIADAFLTHDRPIHIRTDDSVVRSWRAAPMPLRRSRGYAPEPLSLPWDFAQPVLACGAELKNTFCLGKGRHAFCSQHIGDLENLETLRSFTEGIEHFRRLFDIDPSVVAYDLHPEYLSTKYALGLSGVELVGVQHHHAHIASCLADNGESGPVLGVAFDGTGFGADGTIWGGEFLLADLTGFRRLGHLATVPLPGGAAAIRQPWRMAVSYLDRVFGADSADTPATSGTSAMPARLTALPVLRRNERQWRQVAAIGRRGVNSPPTSSAGRLFDAVAALLDVRDEVDYEGQAAIELEQCADTRERGGYPIAWEDLAAALGSASKSPDGGGGDGALALLRVPGGELVRRVVDDLLAGTEVPLIAARFHNSVAEMIAAVCRALRGRTGVTSVALSGGVFQNRLLLDRTADLLGADGFRVLTHSRVPCNDGGISLGQAVVAAARERV